MFCKVKVFYLLVYCKYNKQGTFQISKGYAAEKALGVYFKECSVKFKILD